VVVMAAAVADFRPVQVARDKIKKDDAAPLPEPIVLERTDDVLALVVEARAVAPSGQVIVGFAAETGDATGTVLEHASAKLARKGCDLLVVNDVSGGRVFEQSHNAVTILSRDGSALPVVESTKETVADAIWDRVVAAREATNSG